MHIVPIVWPKEQQAENYMFLKLFRKDIYIGKWGEGVVDGVGSVQLMNSILGTSS